MSGTSETYVIKNENITSNDIALGNFSGHLAFIGESSAQYGGGAGKIIGGVFTVTSGIITGAFDSKLNPNKELDNLVGTSILGIASGWGGGKLGFLIGGPVGAIIGAVVGSVTGALWSDNLYDNLEIVINKILQTQQEKYESWNDLSPEEQEKWIIEELESKFIIIRFLNHSPNSNAPEISEIKTDTSTRIAYAELTNNAILYVNKEEYVSWGAESLLSIGADVKDVVEQCPTDSFWIELK